MALNVSNETKVGALTAIAITLLILGFNFLKGNNPMKSSQYLYAKFSSIEGLVVANPVICNGLVIGSVYKTEPADEFLNEILVTIRLTEKLQIPIDSKATIKGNLLSTPAVEIIKGTAESFLKKGDTIRTEVPSGFMSEVLEQLGPTQSKLNVALSDLDTLLTGVNNTLDANAQYNLRKTIASLSEITANLSLTTKEINQLLAAQNNTITSAIGNLESTSRNLNEGTKNLPAITQNLEKVSLQLSEAEFKKLISDLDATVLNMKATLDKLNSNTNSAGALLNDRKLYENLTSTTNSMNLLLQDLRLHPKRYVNVSVFGKKDKSQPLMKPMAEDSATQEQFRNQ
ncbi:MAG: MlaD family protein [Chitinophagaceae bacterium]|nr:MlaD family protein [Chitinophagaceae bacterium]